MVLYKQALSVYSSPFSSRIGCWISNKFQTMVPLQLVHDFCSLCLVCVPQCIQEMIGHSLVIDGKCVLLRSQILILNTLLLSLPTLWNWGWFNMKFFFLGKGFDMKLVMKFACHFCRMQKVLPLLELLKPKIVLVSWSWYFCWSWYFFVDDWNSLSLSNPSLNVDFWLELSVWAWPGSFGGNDIGGTMPKGRQCFCNCGYSKLKLIVV